MNDFDRLIEKKLNSKNIFKGHLLDVYKDSVDLPDNGSSTREFIRHPGASAVLPIFRNGDILLVRQFRYPVGQIFYEVPAGKIDKGEDPETTAWRELEEETGLVCQNLSYIGHFYPTVGYSDEIIHLYVSWNLTKSETKMEDDEFLIPVRIPFRQALQMIDEDIISDGKTIITLMKVKNWWKRFGAFEIDTIS